jgi:hypothetical protein
MPFLNGLHRIYERYSVAELELIVRFMRETSEWQMQATQQLGQEVCGGDDRG